MYSLYKYYINVTAQSEFEEIQALGPVVGSRLLCDGVDICIPSFSLGYLFLHHDLILKQQSFLVMWWLKPPLCSFRSQWGSILDMLVLLSWRSFAVCLSGCGFLNPSRMTFEALEEGTRNILPSNWHCECCFTVSVLTISCQDSISLCYWGWSWTTGLQQSLCLRLLGS